MHHPTLPYCGRRHRQPIPEAPAIATRDLAVVYPGADAPALDRVSLEVARGASVAVVGPNGSGKSTLLRAMAGLLYPTRGQVAVLGRRTAECHHRVAYLPQRGELDWRFPISVRRLVLTGRYVHLGWLRWPRSRDWALADRALAQLGIADLAERQIDRLSGGQQQRVLLARALAQEADVYLLDEPFTAVDQPTRQVLAGILGDLRRRGRSVIVATHDLSRGDIAFDLAIFLAEGRIVASPSETASAAGAAPGPAWTG